MPRFFLHIREPHQLIEDPDGGDYASLQDARSEAEDSVRDIIAERIKRGSKVQSATMIEIVDDCGSVVDRVGFQDVLATLVA